LARQAEGRGCCETADRRAGAGAEQANDVSTALIMHEWLSGRPQNSHLCMVNKGEGDVAGMISHGTR